MEENSESGRRTPKSPKSPKSPKNFEINLDSLEVATDASDNFGTGIELLMNDKQKKSNGGCVDIKNTSNFIGRGVCG